MSIKKRFQKGNPVGFVFGSGITGILYRSRNSDG